MKRVVFTDRHFGENAYLLINNNEAIVIDPGFVMKEIEVYIKENAVALKAVLLTHGHFDHIYGLMDIKDGMEVYIHSAEREFLFDGSLSLDESFLLPANMTIHTFNDSDELELIGERIICYNTPGHTIGSTCFLIDGDLYSGDTLFKCSVGRTDFKTGDINALNNSLEFILTSFGKNTRVFPGHYEDTTVGYELENNPFYR